MCVCVYPNILYILCVYILYPNIEIHMTSVSLCFEKCETNWFGINKVTDILKGQR